MRPLYLQRRFPLFSKRSPNGGGGGKEGKGRSEQLGGRQPERVAGQSCSCSSHGGRAAKEASSGAHQPRKELLRRRLRGSLLGLRGPPVRYYQGEGGRGACRYYKPRNAPREVGCRRERERPVRRTTSPGMHRAKGNPGEYFESLVDAMVTPAFGNCAVQEGSNPGTRMPHTVACVPFMKASS